MPGNRRIHATDVWCGGATSPRISGVNLLKGNPMVELTEQSAVVTRASAGTGETLAGGRKWAVAAGVLL